MQAGRLRHRVELQEPADSIDPSGGVTQVFTKDLTRWADIMPGKGSERLDAAKVETLTNVKIRIRHHTRIDTTWRIKFGDKIYNINSIINVGERNFMMEIDCIEVQGE